MRRPCRDARNSKTPARLPSTCTGSSFSGHPARARVPKRSDSPESLRSPICRPGTCCVRLSRSGARSGSRPTGTCGPVSSSRMLSCSGSSESASQRRTHAPDSFWTASPGTSVRRKSSRRGPPSMPSFPFACRRSSSYAGSPSGDPAPNAVRSTTSRRTLPACRATATERERSSSSDPMIGRRRSPFDSASTTSRPHRCSSSIVGEDSFARSTRGVHRTRWPSECEQRSPSGRGRFSRSPSGRESL